jgi:hypothetical protein
VLSQIECQVRTIQADYLVYAFRRHDDSNMIA